MLIRHGLLGLAPTRCQVSDAGGKRCVQEQSERSWRGEDGRFSAQQLLLPKPRIVPETPARPAPARKARQACEPLSADPVRPELPTQSLQPSVLRRKPEFPSPSPQRAGQMGPGTWQPPLPPGLASSSSNIYPQSDVKCVHIYENQRWNPVTGYTSR